MRLGGAWVAEASSSDSEPGGPLHFLRASAPSSIEGIDKYLGAGMIPGTVDEIRDTIVRCDHREATPSAVPRNHRTPVQAHPDRRRRSAQLTFL